MANNENDITLNIDASAGDALNTIENIIKGVDSLDGSMQKLKDTSDNISSIDTGRIEEQTPGGGSQGFNNGGVTSGGDVTAGTSGAGNTPNKVSEVARGVIMGRLLRDTFGSLSQTGSNITDVMYNRKTTAEAEYEIAKASADAIGTAMAVKTGSPTTGMLTSAVLTTAINATTLPDKAERAQMLSSELKSYGKHLIQQGLQPSAENMRDYASKVKGYVEQSQKADRLANSITNEFIPSYTAELLSLGNNADAMKKINEIRRKEKLKSEMGGADIQGGFD